MKLIRRSFACYAVFLALVLASLSPASAADPTDDLRRINSIARLMAGIPPILPEHRALAWRKEWKDHGYRLQASWVKVRDGQAKRVKKWRDATLPPVCPGSDNLLYPFSGPDFFNVYWLFPHCGKYVLFGLEPIGAVPAVEKMSPAQFNRLLAGVRAATANLFARNYFVTSRMGKQLKTEELNGVIPIIMIQMALSDVEIVDIRPLDTESFKRHPKAGAPARQPMHDLQGVVIDFRGPRSEAVQQLQYFTVDVSNKALRDYPGFLRYLRKQAPAATLVKSASYLMHIDQFTRIRDALLDATVYLVQDDTGIPYADLERHGFDVRVFGSYMEPIPPFERHYQEALAAAYAQQKPEPLPFFFGYLRNVKDGKRSNIMIAIPAAKAASALPMLPPPTGR